LPSATSQLYTPSKPFEITDFGETKVMAMAIAPGMSASPVAVSDIFEIINRVSTPEIRPMSGTTLVASVQVFIGGLRQGGTAHVTVDGADPTAQSPIYTAPFTLSVAGNVVVKAVVLKEGLADSKIAIAKFIILEQVNTPTFDFMSGVSTTSVIVHITCETPGARIRYTTDSSTPNAASQEYADEITLSVGAHGESATYVIKAIAMDPPSMGNSLVAATAALVVQPQVQAPTITPGTIGPFRDSVRVKLASVTPGT